MNQYLAVMVHMMMIQKPVSKNYMRDVTLTVCVRACTCTHTFNSPSTNKALI